MDVSIEEFRVAVVTAAIRPYEEAVLMLSEKVRVLEERLSADPVAWMITHDGESVVTVSESVADAWRRAGIEVTPLIPAGEK